MNVAAELKYLNNILNKSFPSDDLQIFLDIFEQNKQLIHLYHYQLIHLYLHLHNYHLKDNTFCKLYQVKRNKNIFYYLEKRSRIYLSWIILILLIKLIRWLKKEYYKARIKIQINTTNPDLEKIKAFFTFTWKTVHTF